MHWIKRATLTALLAVTLAVTGLRSAEDKRVAVYAPGISYSLPILEHTNGDYVALPEAVEPLGNVSVHAHENDWRMRFNDVECTFKPGRSRGRVGRTNVELTGPFVLLGEHAYIPLHSLPLLLSRLLGSRVDFHTVSRRIFVGHAATRFTVEVRKGEGMVLTFSEPVNPTISTEPGKLRMTFTREPILSDTGTFQFMDDKLTPGARFSESNGSAELTIQANAPVMATFADGGKTIHIVPAPAPVAQAPSPATSAPPQPTSPQPATPEAANGAQSASPGATAGSAAAAAPAYLVVVDASHGGSERGAALSDKLAEKDVTLAFARKLRGELQARGINTLMLRDSDSILSLEQRADTVNASRAAVYVALHAASLGTGVRVYTAMLPAATTRQQLFVPWELAQSGHTVASRAVANAVAEEIGKREMPSAVVAAPVRPLNNLTVAAIAVEISLPGPQVDTLNSPNYQQQVAAAIASGIAGARAAVEAAK